MKRVAKKAVKKSKKIRVGVENVQKRTTENQYFRCIKVCLKFALVQLWKEASRGRPLWPAGGGYKAGLEGEAGSDLGVVGLEDDELSGVDGDGVAEGFIEGALPPARECAALQGPAEARGGDGLRGVEGE